MPKEIIKRRKLTSSERMEVYRKMEGHCAYCGCDLKYEDMFYISAQKDCTTCKHDGIMGTRCCAECTECKYDGCRCRNCREGSMWEWVGIHGGK